MATQSILESYATCLALSDSASTTQEYCDWLARAEEWRNRLGSRDLTATEASTVDAIYRAKMRAYGDVPNDETKAPINTVLDDWQWKWEN